MSKKNKVVLFHALKFADAISATVEDVQHTGMKRYQIGEIGTVQRMFGPITITAEQLKQAVDNFHNNVRGIVSPATGKPAVHWDYSHDMTGPAAGWIHDLETDGIGLYAWTIWTPKGQQSINDQEFIGASMEIDFDYMDDAEKEWGTVLIGAALTNVPAIKDMEPIALEEASVTTKENIVDYAKLLEALKAASAEDRTKLLNELLSLSGKSNLLAEHASQTVELAQLKAKAAEGATAVQLAEMADLKAQLAAEKDKAAAAAKEQKFNELLTASKVVPAQKAAYLSGDMEKFTELAAKPGSIHLQESGSGAAAEAQAKDQAEAGTKLHELAEERERTGKKSYAAALMEVRKENPALAKLADQ